MSVFDFFKRHRGDSGYQLGWIGSTAPAPVAGQVRQAPKPVAKPAADPQMAAQEVRRLLSEIARGTNPGSTKALVESASFKKILAYRGEAVPALVEIAKHASTGGHPDFVSRHKRERQIAAMALYELNYPAAIELMAESIDLKGIYSLAARRLKEIGGRRVAAIVAKRLPEREAALILQAIGGVSLSPELRAKQAAALKDWKTLIELGPTGAPYIEAELSPETSPSEFQDHHQSLGIALARAGDRRGLNLLARMYQRASYRGHRQGALRGLAEINEVEGAVDLLRVALFDRDADVQATAIDCLARLGHVDAAGPLIYCLEHSYQDERTIPRLTGILEVSAEEMSLELLKRIVAIGKVTEPASYIEDGDFPIPVGEREIDISGVRELARAELARRGA